MRIIEASYVVLAWTTATTLASPFPLPDGFPNPNASGIHSIQGQARGTIPNGGPPTVHTAGVVAALQYLSLNEMLEVAFFTELLHNVTNSVAGFEIGNGTFTEKFIISQFRATNAQEQIHQLTAASLLNLTGEPAIQPCDEYNFPVSNIDDAFALAAEFTSMLMGSFHDIALALAESNYTAEHDLILAVASSISNEAEQLGFFRTFEGKIPNESPFPTSSTVDFGFSYLQRFIDQTTCPVLTSIPLAIFKPLTLVSKISPRPREILFQIDGTDITSWNTSQAGFVFVNQQNMPVVKKFKIRLSKGSVVTISVDFPYQEHQLDGLVITAITNTTGPFTSVRDVAAHTIFGPAPIIVE